MTRATGTPDGEPSTRIRSKPRLFPSASTYPVEPVVYLLPFVALHTRAPSLQLSAIDLCRFQSPPVGDQGAPQAEFSIPSRRGSP